MVVELRVGGDAALKMWHCFTRYIAADAMALKDTETAPMLAP